MTNQNGKVTLGNKIDRLYSAACAITSGLRKRKSVTRGGKTYWIYEIKADSDPIHDLMQALETLNE